MPGDMGKNLLGIPYPPGGVMDRVGESFAGPHDWMRNATGSYDAIGNSIHVTGAARVWDEIKLWGTIPLAAPFAVGGLISTTPGAYAILPYMR